MMLEVTTAISRSSTAITRSVVIASRMVSCESNRDITSPMCRASKNAAGRRRRCEKRLVRACTVKEAPSAIIIQPRIAVSTTCSTRSSAKARTRVNQEVAIGGDQRMVDHPTHEQRARHGEELERQGQGEKLPERPLHAHQPAEQAPELDPGRRGRGLEAARRRELQRHPGEMPGHLVHAQPPHPHGRIVDHHPAPVDRLQDDEMVEIPVQDAGRFQLRQFVELEPERPAGEAQPIGDPDQILARGPP